MPVKNAQRTEPAKAHYKQISYETLAASWFAHDGWEVFLPIIDHGKKTDLIIADDSRYYRIQVKSVETNDESVYVENKWGDERIDYVIYFSRTGNWGYILKPFSCAKKRLNASGHTRFHQHHKQFAKAFSVS